MASGHAQSPAPPISVAELGKDSSLLSHGRINLATSQAASFKTSGPSRKHLWKEDSLETRARDERPSKLSSRRG